MADIELVIKIDEDIYKSRKQKVNNSKRMVDEIELAIANGTPLPKGHDRLIYAKDVGEYLTLADVPTIIEADKKVWIRNELY